MYHLDLGKTEDGVGSTPLFGYHDEHLGYWDDFSSFLLFSPFFILHLLARDLFNVGALLFFFCKAASSFFDSSLFTVMMMTIPCLLYYIASFFFLSSRNICNGVTKITGDTHDRGLLHV